mgnify:FL=1
MVTTDAGFQHNIRLHQTSVVALQLELLWKLDKSVENLRSESNADRLAEKVLVACGNIDNGLVKRRRVFDASATGLDMVPATR